MLAARENPFRMQRIETLRYRLDDQGWRDLLTRFAANRWRGVLVGPHGSGKTTLREELESRLRAQGWQVRTLVLGDDRAGGWSHLRMLLPGAGARTLISLDGLDRIGPLAWWRLYHATRSVGGILATSHVHGRLPTLRQHHTSPALLHGLVQELVGDGDHDQPSLIRRCDELFTRHRGDIRACLRHLYDEAGTLRRRFAGDPSAHPVPVTSGPCPHSVDTA